MANGKFSFTHVNAQQHFL